MNSVKHLTLLHIVGLLFISGFLAYANVLQYPFSHDDIAFIQENPRIAQWNDLGSVVFPSKAPYAPSLVVPYYRPLLEIFYRLQFLLWGLNPHGYHFVNVILHVINSILSYCCALRLLGKKPYALSIAFLFLLHPVQTEAVTCIAGVSNLFFVFFCFLSFLLYAQSLENKNRKNIVFYGLALLCYALGLFAKEQAAVLFAILLLYEVTIKTPQRKIWPERILRLSGFFLVTAWYLLFRKLVLGNTFPSFKDGGGELMLRIAAIPQTFLMYLKILFVPVNLHYYRSIDILEPYPLAPLGLILVVIAGGVLLQKLQAPSRRLALFGLGWFLFALLPTLNIVPLVIEYSSIMASEHFLYFPLFGFLVAGASILEDRKLDMPSVRKNAAFLTVAVCFAFYMATIKQNTFWKNDIAVFKRSIALNRPLARLHFLLGKSYYFNGLYREAVGEYYKALSIMEGYLAKVTKAEPRKFYLGFIKGLHFDLAHCFENMNDIDRAIAEYKSALAIDPADSYVHTNLGVLFMFLKDYETAQGYFSQALKLNPDNVFALNNLGLCYVAKGNFKEAERLFRKVISLDGNFSSAQMNLQRALKKEKF